MRHHSELDALIKAFQDDLSSLSLRDVVRKHISTGNPRELSDQEYHELRSLVANQFRIHPTSVIVVGSTRTGFSLKQARRYQPFNRDSDIDVALVSEKRFDEYWELVFDFARSDWSWRKGRGQMFMRNLFNGWIDPRSLPGNKAFYAAREWTEFFDSLAHQRLFGVRAISARLYRTWDRLEAYQEKAVTECRAEMKT